MGVGDAIMDLEAVHPGMGAAFYDTLRQGLCRWLRVYDDSDARERIEQMTEWAEGEEILIPTRSQSSNQTCQIA